LKKKSGFEKVGVVFTSTSDDVPQSPNFVFGGSAGYWIVKMGDGTFTFVNHEDNFSVSSHIR
jgi:hypothetical protein